MQYYLRSASMMLESMDFSYDPCENFYKFACSKWQEKHKLSPELSSTSSFHILATQMQLKLRGK